MSQARALTPKIETRPTFRGGGTRWEAPTASRDDETESKVDEEIKIKENPRAASSSLRLKQTLLWTSRSRHVEELQPEDEPSERCEGESVC